MCCIVEDNIYLVSTIDIVLDQESHYSTIPGLVYWTDAVIGSITKVFLCDVLVADWYTMNCSFSFLYLFALLVLSFVSAAEQLAKEEEHFHRELECEAAEHRRSLLCKDADIMSRYKAVQDDKKGVVLFLREKVRHSKEFVWLHEKLLEKLEGNDLDGMEELSSILEKQFY